MADEQNLELPINETEILDAQTASFSNQDLSIPTDQIGNEGDVRVAVDDELQVFLYCKANGVWHSQLIGGVDFGSDIVQQQITNIITDGNAFEGETLNVGNLVANTVQAKQQYKDNTTQISSSELIGHPNDNSQAHTDYLKNNAADILEGTLKIKGSLNTNPLGTFSLEIGDGSIASGQYNLVVGNPDNVNNTDGTEAYARRIGFWTNAPTSKLHMNTAGDSDLFHVLDTTGQINIGSDETHTVPGKLNVSPNGSVNIGILASNHTTASPNYFKLNQSDTSTASIENPYGDITVGVLNAFRASASGKDLGTSLIKWGAVHADELIVETLVSQEVFATMGGRITVAPSTILHATLTNSATSISTRHNNYQNGDFAQFKVGTYFEVIQFTTDPVSQNSGEYYTANIQRAIAGTQLQWTEGTSLSVLVNTVGAGIIELTATSTADQNSLGPTQVFKARTGTTTYNDYKTNVILGNMNGAADYSADTFGVAIGEDLYSSSTLGSSRITIDDTNGFRMHNLPFTNYAYESNSGSWFKYFVVDPTAKQFAFGSNTDNANTTNFRIFGSDNTYNSVAYKAGDTLFGSTSTGYANMVFKQFQSGGASAQNILRIGTGTGVNSFMVNADGSGSAANGNISWTNTGALTLTGTLTNIDDQIGDISGAYVYYQSAQPDHNSTRVPVVGDLWYDTDASFKPHYLLSITDDNSSGTAGDDTGDFNWTDIFYTAIDGSSITTGDITAVNLRSFEVTTDTQGVIPNSDTGNRVFEANMSSSPFIRQYEKQDSPSWGSELSGGKLAFHFFENNTKTTYEYTKAQQMLPGRYQELNVTQTFSQMGGKKMPDANYIVIPVEARMPEITVASAYCGDTSLDSYLGYVFDQKTNDSFRGQLIIYYGEESGWMRIPYTVSIGHNQHGVTAPRKEQRTALDSPVLSYPPSNNPRRYFGEQYCGGWKFGYLYNRANDSSISSSRGIYPNQIFQWCSKHDNDTNGGWGDWSDGTLIHGGNPTGDNDSMISHPVDAGNNRFDRGIPNQHNDANYYASGAYDDSIFGSSREGWKNGPLWRDTTTETEELSSNYYQNGGTGTLQELENNSGETFVSIKQGTAHEGAYNGGTHYTSFGCGTWTQVSSNYAEPVFFGNAETANDDTNFYGEWLDPDNSNAVWRTGINLLRWRSRAHIVYKAHAANDWGNMHQCYETYGGQSANRGKGHIAWGAVVQGNTWYQQAATNYAYSTSEFGTPNLSNSIHGRMHLSREESGWKDKIGPICQVVPHGDLSMMGDAGSGNQGGAGTMYRSNYGFLGNVSGPAQVDENLYWHYRNGNGQISWYESDNNAQGQMTIGGDSTNWHYIVKHYEREHICAAGIDDQGMWAPIGNSRLGYVEDLTIDVTGNSLGVGPQHQFGMQVPCGWMSRWNPQSTTDTTTYADELFTGSPDKSPELVYFSWGRLEGKSIPIPVRRIGTGTGTSVHNISSSADVTKKLFGQHIMSVDSDLDAEQKVVTIEDDVAPFETDTNTGFASGIEDLLQ